MSYLGIIVRLMINAANTPAARSLISSVARHALREATAALVRSVRNGTAGRKSVIRVK